MEHLQLERLRTEDGVAQSLELIGTLIDKLVRGLKPQGKLFGGVQAEKGRALGDGVEPVVAFKLLDAGVKLLNRPVKPLPPRFF